MTLESGRTKKYRLSESSSRCQVFEPSLNFLACEAGRQAGRQDFRPWGQLAALWLVTPEREAWLRASMSGTPGSSPAGGSTGGRAPGGCSGAEGPRAQLFPRPVSSCSASGASQVRAQLRPVHTGVRRRWARGGEQSRRRLLPILYISGDVPIPRKETAWFSLAPMGFLGGLSGGGENPLLSRPSPLGPPEATAGITSVVSSGA